MVLDGANHRRMMILRAFLAQNVAVGCAFGSFGVAVIPLQQHYGASRGMVSLCLSLCMLAMGLASPLIGSLIARIGLRSTMIIGTLLSGVGYALLAVAPGMSAVLVLYALPVGIGLAMFGPFPASVLASNWSPDNPGLALGIVNMPLLVAILPLAGVALIAGYGLMGLYLTLAGLHLLLLPVLLGVTDRPARAMLAQADVDAIDQPDMLPTRKVLGTAVFWTLSVGGGYLSSVGLIGITHLAPFAAERGIPGEQAALLLSIVGGSSVVGSLLVGFLCGRIGAALTLALIAATQAGGWFVLHSSTAFPVMAATTLLLGVGGAGVFPAISVLSGRLFEIASLPRVVGLYGLITLPLTFGIPPLAGLLRDAMGNYGPVVMMIVAGSSATALLFVGIARLAARRPLLTAPAT